MADCREISRDEFDSKLNLDGSKDCIITGSKGEVALQDFPHPRHLCGNSRFATTPHENCCCKCYCLVCDIPALNCQKWKGSDGHCHITQKVENESTVTIVQERNVNKCDFLKGCFCFS